MISKNDNDHIKRVIKRELNINGDIAMKTKVKKNMTIRVDLPDHHECLFEKKVHKSAHTVLFFHPDGYINRKCSHPKCYKIHNIKVNSYGRNAKENPKQNFVSDEECDSE